MLKKSLILIFLLGFLACSNDDSPSILEGVGTMESNPQNYEQCGWVINVDGNYLKPNRLPVQYEQEGLVVYFTYEDLMEEEACQTAGFQLARIRLEQIKPR